MATTTQPQPTMYATPERDGLKAPFASVHHVALVTHDMKRTVDFYRDVLGSEVALGHRMPRPGAERHYMITVAPGTVFAFFEFPDAKLPDYKAATLPTTGRAFDHVCFTVESMEQFNAWYERLTAAGVDNLSPIQEMGPGSHAYFFSDPNGIVLEVIAPNPMMRFPVLEDPDPAY